MNRTIPIAGAVALIIVVLAVLGASLIQGKPPGATAAHPAPAAAPTPGGIMMPDEGRTHVDPPAVIPYKHYPPTSGTHYYIWAPLGIYPAKKFPDPLPEGYWVHNLEHGAVVVLYNCPKVCPALVKQLTGLMKAFPNDKYGQVKAILTPYSHMTHRIAIVSWRWIDQMDTFDKSRLVGFYRLHVNHGPEDIGPDAYISQ